LDISIVRLRASSGAKFKIRKIYSLGIKPKQRERGTTKWKEEGRFGNRSLISTSIKPPEARKPLTREKIRQYNSAAF